MEKQIETENSQQLRVKIENFLNLNYPCNCMDADCSGNYFEAQELVRLMEENS